MISIVGSGQVGTAVAFLCVSNALDDVLLVNRTKEKAIGESLDVANAIPSTSKFSIKGTDDYSKLSNSDIIVITASTGVYMKDRTENMNSQVIMIKEIAKKIKQYCYSPIVLLVSNPLDVLTYFFQKESDFSRFKVFGIASSLDTSRFRYLISEKFNISQSFISNALVIGEHGDSMVPIFSNVLVKAAPLLSMLTDRNPMTDDIRNYWRLLRKYKSRSQYGIAKNTYDVLEALVNSKELSVPVSVVLDGEYGENNVSMGVPVRINQNGISEIQNINLDKFEKTMLKNSSKVIRDHINSIQL
ncbi:malate dehydrogenase [Nitrosopumilus sp.]|uniref:malate dehydrogenase n=1 Tax=Nitrosopumilus sp. TaxID=2024843 RepID=UPI00292E2C13|nr:lactate dehydrogenase [Nitrosopumilus sp.]